MAYPCSECGERKVQVSLTNWYCAECGASWPRLAGGDS